MSSMLTAAVMGIVEGLTEYLPVSSTGHLILVGHWLNFEGEGAKTFEIFIQLGAILAVVLLYPDRFRALLDFKSKSPWSGKRACLLLGVASLPAFIFGFILHKFIKEHLFSPLTVALALIVGGVVMIIVERVGVKSENHSLEEIGIKSAFYVGLFQVLALWPGMSRSACTIIGGMLSGLSRTVAAQFSFLVAVPVMTVAVGYDALKSFGSLSFGDVPTFAVGFMVSTLVAMLAIKALVAFLQKYSLAPFGIYRILVGAIVLLFMR